MDKKFRIIDEHVHCSPQTDVRYLAEFLSETGTDMAVIQAVSHSRCLSLVPEALVMKAMFPGRFFVFGSPDSSAYYFHRDDLGEYLAGYMKRLSELGCDGIKMLEGKPQMRKMLPIPDFDDRSWEKYWEYVEESGTPVTFHVNDPENHWSNDVSDWVKKQGWWYDETFVNNEDQYRQVLNVLKRHESLRLILAHFFFLSARLERLDDILDRFPGIMVDLTPGIEMYENFSRNKEETEAFFEKHRSRIVYGTDIGGRCILTNENDSFNEKENFRRPVIVREFLCGTEEREIVSDGNYLIQREPFVMRPLGLSGERLEEIFSGNILRQIGHEPKSVCGDAIMEECAEWRRKLKLMQEKGLAVSPDYSQIELAERYFNKN